MKKKLKEYKKTLKLTRKQRDIIIGTLLGDSSIEVWNWTPTRNPAIKFEQGNLHKEYLFHLHSEFKDWTGSDLPKQRFIKGGGARNRSSWYFKTYSHDSLRFYRSLFYNKLSKKKQVPKLIHKFLSARSLAYWYMDDGSLRKDGCFILNTQGFSFNEITILQKALLYKFNLDVSIHKDKIYYRLYIKKNSTLIFYNLILPYIHFSMLYKIKQKKSIEIDE